MDQKISLGRVVHYTLTKQDADEINRRRDGFIAEGWPATAQRHVGNQVNAGDVFPLIVTRVWDAETGSFNGQLMLDGSDTLWITSAVQGEGEGYWFWPPRV